MLSIAERLRPFSNELGTKVLLPGTSTRLTVYPTRVEFHDLSGTEPVHIRTEELPLRGPIEGFTVQQDLEKACVSVWGRSPDGHFRYSWSGEKKPALERLSLGCHKKQDWTLVMRRFEMAEVFPFWYHLAQLVPPQKPALYVGTASLLPACCEAIVQRDRVHLLKPFQNLLRAGFEGMLSPRLHDTDYQGFELKELKGNPTPLAHLTEGALLMRSLFFQREENRLLILPALPVEFHAGRLLQIRCGEYGTLDIEWTKKLIRRMVFVARKTGEIRFEFQKGIRSFRLQRGTRLSVDDVVCVEAGKEYLLDRFEK